MNKANKMNSFFSCGIFRRNSRETYSSSSSPLGKRSSSLANMNTSPKCSPEHSRNPSPTPSPVSQRASSKTLTPPSLPYQLPRQNNEPNDSSLSAYAESPSRARKTCGSFCGQPTPPGSPSRSYGYYTSSPARSPTSSPSLGSGGGIPTPGSPSRSFKQGKVIHCPSTPPRKHPSNVSQLTPPSSPIRSLKNKNRRDLNTTPTRDSETQELTNSRDRKGEQRNKRSAQSSFRDEMATTSSPHKRITRLCKRETKSLELGSPPTTPVNDNRTPVKKLLTIQKGVPNSPAAQHNVNMRLHNTRSSPSRFCQAVTRLLPQIVTLNGSSRLCKNISKPFASKSESATLYVDENGRSSLKPTKAGKKTNEFLSSSSIESKTPNNSQSSLSFDDEDEETRVVIFELCKNIQKLPKENEISPFEASDAKVHERDPPPQEGVRSAASLHATIDISSYRTSGANASIIINPIFSLENKYEEEALCNNKNNAKANYSAFLEDDIIYVQTTQRENTATSIDEDKSKVKEGSVSQNNNSESAVIVTDSVVVPLSQQIDIRVNPCNEEKISSKCVALEAQTSTLLDDSSSDSESSERGQNAFQRDFSICKRNSSSFKPEEDPKVKGSDGKAKVKPPIREKVNLSLKQKPIRSSKNSSSTKSYGTNPVPPIHTASLDTNPKSRNKSFSRPPSGPPPPLPPRKGLRAHSNPLTPPPVPPRNMKPQGVQSPPQNKPACSLSKSGPPQSWQPASSSTKPMR